VKQGGKTQNGGTHGGGRSLRSRSGQVEIKEEGQIKKNAGRLYGQKKGRLNRCLERRNTDGERLRKRSRESTS